MGRERPFSGDVLRGEDSNIKLLKGVARVVKVLVVWFVVAVITGVIVVIAHPPENPKEGANWIPAPGISGRVTFGLGLVWKGATGPVGVGIGLAWWNLPGTILGLLSGIYLSRKSWFGILEEPPR